MMDELLSEAEGAIHRLTSNRPARRNALTPEIARAIARGLDQTDAVGPAELAVPRGVGGLLSSGLGLRWLSGLGSVSVAELQRGLADFQAAALAVVRLPVPVFAVMEGTVAGFGLDLGL